MNTNETGTQENVSQEKIYTGGQIGVAAFFGSLIAAGYMLGHNQRVVGKKSENINIYLIFGGIMIALVTFMFLLPEEITDNVSSTLFSIIYVAIALTFYNKNKDAFTEILVDRGARKSNWKVFGVIVVSVITILVLLVVVLLPIFFLFPELGASAV